MSRIVILGSGFGGLTAVRTLRQQGCTDTITLVSPQAKWFYYPSLIWVPAGLRDEASLTVNLSDFFDKQRVNHHPGNVTGLDPAARKVSTDNGELEYDALIIAGGGRFIKKLPGIEHVYTPCEGFAPTQQYSEHLNRLHSGTLAFGFSGNPKDPSAMRGGPVFEFLFGIDTLLRKRGRREQFDMVFFSPAPRPGQRLGTKAVDKLLGEMRRRGIRTHLGHKLKGFEADKVLTEGGEVQSDLTLFMPGMTGPAWTAHSNLPLTEGGFFQADEYCRVQGHENIFVVGDSGSFPGPDWIPKQAHMADLQAVAAAKNLLAIQNGQAPTHTPKVELICIVDTLNSGILVYRSLKHNLLLPGGVLFHWSKRFFEWYYMRMYR